MPTSSQNARCSRLVLLALAMLTGCTPAGRVGAPPAPVRTAEAPVERKPPAAAAAAVAVQLPLTVEPWTWTGADGGTGAPVAGRLVGSRHYRIRSTVRDEASTKSVARFMESALEHYTSALGPLPEPSRPLETYLFGTRDEWADFTRMRMKRDAGTYLALGRGGYTIDGEVILYDLGRWDTLALAAHEGWHQYTQSTFRHPLPIWLEEGLATYMEGHRWARGEDEPVFSPWRNNERYSELRSAVRDDELIPLDELLAGIPQGFLRDGRSKLLTYYAQVWALAQYLAHGEDGRYRPALEELLQDAISGRVASKVASSPNLPPGRSRALASKVGRSIVLVYFNGDFAAFKEGYDRFVADITRRGAGEFIWRGQSPISSGAASTPVVAAPDP
ncbi:MAG: hypothetical protein SGJ11_03810 [Phycisphaerae bacterium]|nr:hypothetical protein [Phycisphaerae bacterium]